MLQDRCTARAHIATAWVCTHSSQLRQHGSLTVDTDSPCPPPPLPELLMEPAEQNAALRAPSSHPRMLSVLGVQSH